jgi:16S rRNA processing protein RimM
MVRVEVLTDRPEERFKAGRVLHVEGDAAPLTVVWARPVADGPGWRLRFREVPDRAAADRLREVYLEVEADRERDLAPGEAWWHDVLGAVVRTGDGRELGRVVDIYRAGENEVYLTRDEAGREVDVPAVMGVITTFAPERGEIVVDEARLAIDEPPIDERPATSRPRRRARWSRHGKGRTGASGETSSGTPSGGEA